MTVALKQPFGSFESSVQYSWEYNTAGYGVIPSTLAGNKATQTVLAPLTQNFWTFGNTVKADPMIDIKRYKIRGLTSRSARYTRAGNRAVEFNFSVNPQPINLNVDTTYAYSDQNIIDLLCLAMGTAYNTTDDPNAAQWSSPNTPYLTNALPSITIEHIIKRRGASPASGSSQKWELGCGMVCKALTISAEVGRAFTADMQLHGQDMTWINALTSGDKRYTVDAEGVSFGAGGMFGNTILSTDATTQIFQTVADATRINANPYMFYNQGFKYCYKDAYDSIPLESDYLTPTNIRSWKLHFANNFQPQWGLNADGRKFINYTIPTERDINLDFVANYVDTEHYQQMIQDNKVLYIKIRMGGNYAIRLMNGKAFSAKYVLNNADLIGLDTHIEFESQMSGEDTPITGSTAPYCAWVLWNE